jgi:hypothetical protein
MPKGKDGYEYRSAPAAAIRAGMVDVRLSGGVIQDVTNRGDSTIRVFDYDVEGTPQELLDQDEQGEPCIITEYPAMGSR